MEAPVIAGYAAAIKLNNLVIISLTTLGNGISNFTSQNLEAGKMAEFMASTFTDLILRVVLAVILSGLFGAVGIWTAWPVGWLVGTTVSLFFYRRFKKAL